MRNRSEKAATYTVHFESDGNSDVNSREGMCARVGNAAVRCADQDIEKCTCAWRLRSNGAGP